MGVTLQYLRRVWLHQQSWMALSLWLTCCLAATPTFAIKHASQRFHLDVPETIELSVRDGDVVNVLPILPHRAATYELRVSRIGAFPMKVTFTIDQCRTNTNQPSTADSASSAHKHGRTLLDIDKITFHTDQTGFIVTDGSATPCKGAHKGQTIRVDFEAVGLLRNKVQVQEYPIALTLEQTYGPLSSANYALVLFALISLSAIYYALAYGRVLRFLSLP